jgi:D-glycero-D-manno-heptose 1,7-bisphosphate phosphatase
MKVVFLDRDGVINEYPGHGEYVTNHRQFNFIPGSIEGIRKLKNKGFKLFVVSNQAGVSKGLYSQKDLEIITNKMVKGLKKKGVEVDGVHYCMHRNEDNCDCRKPKTGLLEEAIKDFVHKTKHTFFIGDSFRDMNAARAFGAKTILVLSGKEKISNRSNWEFEPDYVFDNLLLAAHYLCSHYG